MCFFGEKNQRPWNYLTLFSKHFCGCHFPLTVQVIISVSKLIGVLGGLSTTRFQESLAIVNNYASSDKSIQVSQCSAVFVDFYIFEVDKLKMLNFDLWVKYLEFDSTHTLAIGVFIFWIDAVNRLVCLALSTIAYFRYHDTRVAGPVSDRGTSSTPLFVIKVEKCVYVQNCHQLSIWKEQHRE